MHSATVLLSSVSFIIGMANIFQPGARFTSVANQRMPSALRRSSEGLLETTATAHFSAVLSIERDTHT
jgi:hypothetical protein